MKIICSNCGEHWLES